MALQKPTFSHNYLTTKPTQMKKSYRSGNHCFGNPIANTEQKLTRHNIEVTSVEMALFEMMQRADIDEFKAVSKIVK